MMESLEAVAAQALANDDWEGCAGRITAKEDPINACVIPFEQICPVADGLEGSGS